ncbi:MAG: HD domain-containing protein, partial [Gemmatimonadota bacterium]
MTRAATLPDRLQRIVEESPESLDAELLGRAWEYAREAHEGQSRVSGAPYVEHPLAVASILADFYADTASLAAALLHDTVEDTDADLEEIASRFGTEVAVLVDGLTKIRQFELPEGADRQIETYRKLILSTAEDARVLLVKLADRLHNMRTLDALDEERRRKIARETRGFYAPMAHRLGMHRVKAELEDL